MSLRNVSLLLTLIGVLVLTGFVVAEHGYPLVIPPSGPAVRSMFDTLVSTWPGRLSAVNQSIALVLILIWLWFDCGKRIGTMATYTVLTALLGVPGPLLYLLRRPDRPSAGTTTRPEAGPAVARP